MEKNIASCTIGKAQGGQRLDAALTLLFPGLGLRGRRRIWKGHLVLVDGVARSPAFRVHGGETLRLVPAPPESESACVAYAGDPPRLLARREKLFFVYKPGGLHTESLAGGVQPSLANLLGCVFALGPDMPDTPAIRLLTRLDQETSGIVLAAGEEGAARYWRELEDTGAIVKHYLAVLEGELDAEHTARKALDLTKARRTRVLDTDGPVLRHTHIRPLAAFQAADAPGLPLDCPGGMRLTLALCRIAKGARHQIRAHTAHIGYPLAGDALYGAQCGRSFFLHHYSVQWPEGRISCPPPWQALLPVAAREAIGRV